MVKCGRCKKTYNNDPKFFDGDVLLSFKVTPYRKIRKYNVKAIQTRARSQKI